MLWVQNWGASLFWCAGQGQSLWEKNISWSHLYIAKLQDQWSLMSFCFPSFHIPGHLSKSVNSSSKKITPTQPFTTSWIGYFPFSLPRERSWLKCLRRSFEKRWLRCRCDLMLPAVTEENGGKTKVWHKGMEFWWWLTSWVGGACQRVHGMEWYTKLRRVKVFESEISWSLFLEKLAVISTIPFTLQFFVLHDEIRAFWFGIVGHYKYINLPIQQDYHTIFGALWTTHVLGVVGVGSASDPWFRCLRFALKSWCVLCQRWRRQTMSLLESDGAWQTRWWPGGGFKCFSIFTPYTWGDDMSESPNNLREFVIRF